MRPNGRRTRIGTETVERYIRTETAPLLSTEVQSPCASAGLQSPRRSACARAERGASGGGRRGAPTTSPVATATHATTPRGSGTRSGRGHKRRTPQTRKSAAFMLLAKTRQTGQARRHWNSPSYRTAAGTVLMARIVPASTIGRPPASHGAEGDRTPDLCSAIAALSQLSYSPSLLRRSTSFAAEKTSDCRPRNKTAPRVRGAAGTPER